MKTDYWESRTILYPGKAVSTGHTYDFFGRNRKRKMRKIRAKF